MKQLYPPETIQLLKDAARQFEKGTTPFADEFLTKHSVSLNQCMAMSDTIAFVLAGFASLSLETQTMIIVAGATELAGVAISPEIIEDAAIRLRTIKRLQLGLPISGELK